MFLACSAFMDLLRGAPSPCNERYLAREQNKEVLVANQRFMQAFVGAVENGV